VSVFRHYSRYYDLLYQSKDYDSEVGFVVQLLERYSPRVESILDLGCGTGRHALEFVRRGFNVHGIDLSAGMVDNARARVTAETRDRLGFSVDDVRTARLDRHFDAVVSLFHVASYQTSNNDFSNMLATAAEHLRSGGLFVFDCWYGPAVLTDRPVVRIKRLADEVVAVTRITEPEFRPNQDIVDVNFTVHVVDKATQSAEEIRECHSMRYFFQPQLRASLEQAGFDVLDMVEWVTGKALGFDTWYATIVARKL
jgi:SAM-dependent methyltransferase